MMQGSEHCALSNVVNRGLTGVTSVIKDYARKIEARCALGREKQGKGKCELQRAAAPHTSMQRPELASKDALAATHPGGQHKPLKPCPVNPRTHPPQTLLPPPVHARRSGCPAPVPVQARPVSRPRTAGARPAGSRTSGASFRAPSFPHSAGPRCGSPGQRS